MNIFNVDFVSFELFGLTQLVVCKIVCPNTNIHKITRQHTFIKEGFELICVVTSPGKVQNVDPRLFPILHFSPEPPFCKSEASKAHFTNWGVNVPLFLTLRPSFAHHVMDSHVSAHQGWCSFSPFQPTPGAIVPSHHLGLASDLPPTSQHWLGPVAGFHTIAAKSDVALFNRLQIVHISAEG